MNTNKRPLVSIQCLAYNHEPYLRQCLDGFIMQKTNFSFEVIIHDDASTDNTAEIIRQYVEKYPDIIKPIYEKENQYSKNGFNGIFKIMNEYSNGKYVAMCEGDDYWIDPYKLQKQIDILEKYPEISMVYTNFNTVDENGVSIERHEYESFKQKFYTGDHFLKLLNEGNFIMTLTTVYRRNIFESLIIKEAPCNMDYLLILCAAGLGNLYYLSDVTASYRKISTSIMNSNIQYVIRKTIIIRAYIEYVYLQGKLPKRNISKFIKLEFIKDYLHIIKKKESFRINIISLIYRNPSLIFFLFIYFIKYVYKRIRKKD